ncbi:MAG: Na+/H+ antiporter subunit E [Pseudomonadota bacterium]
MIRLVMKPVHIVWLIVFFLWELINSAWRVFIAVFARKIDVTPRFHALPLDARSDVQITMTANMITLTPGTLTVDVSPDRKHLLIHSMFTEEGTDMVNASIKDGLEKVVMRATQ